MIVWREKLVAMGIHFVATSVLAGIAAALVFLVWFPPPFEKMVGGSELFMLVVGCDMVLGPLLSLVIYNSRKSRRELLMDYGVVGAIQIGALIYGVMIMAGARPLYVAYYTDRFEIVLAADLRDQELAAATDPKYATRHWTGPEFVGITVPDKDKNNALEESMVGNEEHMRPKFYVPFETVTDRIRQRGKTLAELEKKKPAIKPLIAAALRDVEPPHDRLLWVPSHSFKSFWTVIVDPATGMPVAWVDYDPYD
jgi:hypothetical protein